MRDRSPSARQVSAFVSAGKAMGLWPRGGGLLYNLRRQLFRRFDFKGQSFLDIGCSNGRYCAWAALNGAGRAVGIEPMASGSGSSHNAKDYFEGFAKRLGLTTMEFFPVSLQDFECDNDTFDIVLLHAVINHIDEEACIVLEESAEARERYCTVFRKIHDLMKDGGTLIVVDAGRKNLFSDLGFERNPFRKRIHFIKHQQPHYWAALLYRCGFENAKISWISRARYRQLGAPLRNPLAAYLLALAFRLEMTSRKLAESRTPYR